MKNNKTYPIRLPETLLNKAFEVAEKKNTKLSKEIRGFIDEFIDEETNDQTIEMDKAHFHLRIMQSVQQSIPAAVRKRTMNWKLVMDYMLGNTSRGGRTSCMVHCEFMGVNPDGYTFWENKED